VNRNSFEQRLLHLWMTSRVPFTTPNLQFYTGLDRAKLQRSLDELVGSGMLEVDSDDAGELVWIVTGAQRPASGPTHVADVVKLEQLKSELPQSSRALVKRDLASRALADLGAGSGGSGNKSLIASGALSFFLGPLGWLYAAPLKEAGAAVLIYWLLLVILPHALLAPLLGVLAPVSAGIGVLYAWRHNQRGERTSLVDSVRGSLPPRR
jgi:hypothetical protein